MLRLLLIESFSLLSKETQARTVLIFVGDGPLAARLPQLCASKNVRAVFLGQLTGTALAEAFASADVMRYLFDSQQRLGTHAI
jgi:hypothetical protein